VPVRDRFEATSYSSALHQTSEEVKVNVQVKLLCPKKATYLLEARNLALDYRLRRVHSGRSRVLTSPSRRGEFTLSAFRLQVRTYAPKDHRGLYPADRARCSFVARVFWTAPHPGSSFSRYLLAQCPPQCGVALRREGISKSEREATSKAMLELVGFMGRVTAFLMSSPGGMQQHLHRCRWQSPSDPSYGRTHLISTSSRGDNSKMSCKPYERVGRQLFYHP